MPENEKDPAHPGRRQSKTTTGDFLPFLCKLISKQNLVTSEDSNCTDLLGVHTTKACSDEEETNTKEHIGLGIPTACIFSTVFSTIFTTE